MSVQVIHGDCLEVMRGMAGRGETFHAIVTDPPYHFNSIVKRFGAANAAAAAPGVYARSSAGFMGKRWDGGDIAFRPETWRLALDVLKPGAYLLAFGGTRGWHRMVCAIEDAGFEIRDSIMWLYAAGFPKSHDASKAIDKALGSIGGRGERKPDPRWGGNNDAALTGKRVAMRDTLGPVCAGSDSAFVYAPATPEAAVWQGWGTALKPSWEPVCVARKPLDGTVAANLLKHGCGAIYIDGCRIPARDKNKFPAGADSADGAIKTGLHGKPRSDDACPTARWPANTVHDGSDEVEAAFAAFGPLHGDSGTASRFFFSGKASKSDRVSREVEEVTIEWTSEQGPCRLVLQADTEQSHLKAIVVSGSADAREWSTFLCGNSITDLFQKGSKCIISMGPNWTTASRTWKSLTTSLINASTEDDVSSTASGLSRAGNAEANILQATIMLAKTVSLPGAALAVSQTPLKISVGVRQTGHPTCKPLSLMRYLVRLVTPPGGRLLDPFAGSGTAGMAAMAEGFDATLIEQDAESVADIKRRIAHVRGADSPLFAEPDGDNQNDLFGDTA